MVMSMYLCVYTFLYNLQSPFSVSHVYMCPSLTLWDWKTYVDRGFSLEETGSPFLRSQFEPIALHPGV